MIKISQSNNKIDIHIWASLVAQLVKNPPAMWETWVPSLDWEDPLEKGKATHSSILTWRIPWTEEPGRLQSMESQRVGHDLGDLAHSTRMIHGTLKSRKIFNGSVIPKTKKLYCM